MGGRLFVRLRASYAVVFENRPPRLHASPTAPALRVSTLLRRSDTLRPFSVCDRAQTWLHYRIAPAIGRRFFADGLSACLRPRA